MIKFIRNCKLVFSHTEIIYSWDYKSRSLTLKLSLMQLRIGG
ncbi:hypothetical protein FDUTEX481_05129 [Tolypothrix sp. PCC 7601]|nr:hypothetical protein FDUTEX481_05129 [Tolypothrix sp. PCC 7601]